MPLGKVAGQRRKWLTNAVAYTLAGAVTSALVGGGLGVAGGLLLPDRLGRLGTVVALAVAVVALARELGLVAVPLPQIGRQTQGLWAKRYSGATAATLWGLDLGLTFTTWLDMAGPWVLAAVAFLGGDPLIGVALFVAYWLGRALPVWIGPLMVTSATDTPALLASLDDQQRLFRSVHVAALAWSAVAISIWMGIGTSI